jgi:hypothetical protein
MTGPRGPERVYYALKVLLVVAALAIWARSHHA